MDSATPPSMTIEDGPTFGEYLRDLRREKGFAVRDLASRLGTGVGFIYEVERDQRAFSTAHLFHTAEILEVPRARLAIAAARSMLKRKGLWAT